MKDGVLMIIHIYAKVSGVFLAFGKGEKKHNSIKTLDANENRYPGVSIF